MHPHTRRKTKQRLGRLSPRRGQPAPASEAVKEPPALRAAADEKAHLAQDLAYFHAERYREVKPGDTRSEDVEHAESEIAALFALKKLP